jgi:hypothetical protein
MYPSASQRRAGVAFGVVNSNGCRRLRSLQLPHSDRRDAQGPGLVQPVGISNILIRRHPHTWLDIRKRRSKDWSRRSIGLLAPNPLNTRSRASRLAKCGSCANHFRRRPPPELTTRNATPLRLGAATLVRRLSHLFLPFASSALREIFLLSCSSAPVYKRLNPS